MRLPRPALLLLVLSGLVPDATSGQSVRALYSVGRGSLDEFEDLSGVGVAAVIALPSSLTVDFGLRSIDYTFVQGEQTVCRTWNPEGFCEPDTVRRATDLFLVSAILHRRLGLGDYVEVSGGGGLTIASVDATAVGVETGKLGNLDAQKTAQIGFSAAVDASLYLPLVPVIITASALRHALRLEGCQTSSDVLYAPFCGWQGVTELQISAGIAF